MAVEKELGAGVTLTHPALRPGSPPSRTPGEGAERSEAGEGLAVPAAFSDPSDIHHGDWVERHLPTWSQPYARLARLDRPIGTWLLLFPGWWGIALAASGWPDPALLLLFALGAVTMRGAGCTLNDIADRHYDAQVARTRLRPLPSGAVTLWQAALFLLFQLAIGAAVLFSLNWASVLLGVAVLGLIGTYPFMKRVTYWPQVFLGLNFNWGALIGWTAVTGELALPPLLLYLGGIFWTIGYAAALTAWAMAGLAAGLGFLFWLGLAGSAVQLAWQPACVAIDDPADCLRKFRSNRAVGWLMLAAIVAGHFA